MQFWKGFLIVSLLTLGFVVTPVSSWAFQNEPKSFRGIKWGTNIAELSEMVREAMAVWIESALEDGETIPLPRSVEDYRGRFVIRIPKSLHKELVEMAERDGVSLNTYVNVALG